MPWRLLADFADAQAKLNPLVTEYRAWISAQTVPTLSAKRKETAESLQSRAQVAADRIAQGIALLEDPQCLEAFQARQQGDGDGRAAAVGRDAGEAARSRSRRMAAVPAGVPADEPARHRPPRSHEDREVVDLLFFPTGGGKTEAYLGLAAFTLVLRGCRTPASPARA